MKYAYAVAGALIIGIASWVIYQKFIKENFEDSDEDMDMEEDMDMDMDMGEDVDMPMGDETIDYDYEEDE